MKRCSKCEFIYEDDQRFCDMDGTELASDPGPFQFTQDVSARTKVSKSRRLRFLQSQFSLAALAFVGVLLSALVIGYYDSVSQAGSTAANRESVESFVPSAQAETTDTSTNQQEITAAEDSATTERTSSTSLSGTRVGSSTSNLAANKRRAGRDSQAVEQKKESKVTKMFKKTGRFLTKPFKKL